MRILISVYNDEDLHHTMTEYDYLCCSSSKARLRLFLFLVNNESVHFNLVELLGSTHVSKFDDSYLSPENATPPPPPPKNSTLPPPPLSTTRRFNSASFVVVDEEDDNFSEFHGEGS